MIGSDYQPKVAAVVLAAGLSSRMAPVNKLLTRGPAGMTMVASVVQACAESRATCLRVVIGHQATGVRDAVLVGRLHKPLCFVHALGYREGMSASLRAGISTLPSWIDGALICLGDMPFVGAELMNSMIAAFLPETHQDIIVPKCQSRRGNPVLWGRRYFPTLCALSGDAGAGRLLDGYAETVDSIEECGPEVVLDIDTVDANPNRMW